MLDTSAIVAIALSETGHERLHERLAPEADRVLSAASYVEAAAVLAGRVPDDPEAGLARLDVLIRRLKLVIAPVDEAQARRAAAARLRIGKGFGGPLNYGDTFAYALAKTLDAPLLFVGEDFRRTDVTPALA